MSDKLLELEFSILGQLLKEPGRMGECAAAIRPEDFSETVSRSIFAAMSALHFEGVAIDRLSLLHRLGEDYAVALDEAEKRSAGDLLHYCRMLREESQLDRIKSEALGLSYCSDLSEAMGHVERINKLSADRPGRKCFSMGELLTQYMDDYGKRRAGEFLPWGFRELDEQLFARPGDFVVLGGYPSAGKTALSIQWALQMARDYRVGYYSFETGALTLTERILSHATGLPLGRIKREALTGEELKQLTTAAERLHELSIDWIPCAGATVSDIKAESLNRKHEIIFVDYLQQISSRGVNRYEAVTEISQELSTLARSQRTTVIALAQLSRPEKTQKGEQFKRPNMSSFRESGQIEQDADIAFLLYPENLNDNHSTRVLAVGKNKEGERPILRLDFDGARQRFARHKNTPSEQYHNAKAACRKAEKKRAAGQTTFCELSDDGEPLPF